VVVIGGQRAVWSTEHNRYVVIPDQPADPDAGGPDAAAVATALLRALGTRDWLLWRPPHQPPDRSQPPADTPATGPYLQLRPQGLADEPSRARRAIAAYEARRRRAQVDAWRERFWGQRTSGPKKP
jgi:hypothetical protein